jgi:hypothetical protein
MLIGLPKLVKPLNAKLNTVCHLLALVGAHPIFHISRIRVNSRKERIGKKLQSAVLQEKNKLLIQIN